jgi:hypothetical protein
MKELFKAIVVSGITAAFMSVPKVEEKKVYIPLDKVVQIGEADPLFQEACFGLGRRNRDKPNVTQVQIVPAQIQTSSSNLNNQSVVVQLNANFERLQNQIDAAFSQIESIEGQTGEPGPAGPAGPPGANGEDGEDGQDGVSPSAADVAQNINMQELVNNIDLDNLKGEQGEQGPAGESPSAADVAANINMQELVNNIDMGDLKGEQGEQGEQGPPGEFNIEVLDQDGDGIYEQLPPFYVRVEDPDGVYSMPDYVPVHLGDELDLMLIPTASGGVQGGLDVSVNPGAGAQ